MRYCHNCEWNGDTDESGLCPECGHETVDGSDRKSDDEIYKEENPR